jgi:hypothetical protein
MRDYQEDQTVGYETPQTERAIVGREEPQVFEELGRTLREEIPTPKTLEKISYEEQIADLTAQQVLQQYEIRIRFLDKGCIVSLGCKDVAFGDTELAIDAVSEYVNNPKVMSKKWREKFNMH